MTLDKAEREQREQSLRYSSSNDREWLVEAHTRIEELEEAWHAARLRIEELEILRDDLNGLFVEENDRAEGYRRAAIILRDKVGSLLEHIERREDAAGRVIARLERELDATEQELAAERGHPLW